MHYMLCVRKKTTKRQENVVTSYGRSIKVHNTIVEGIFYTCLLRKYLTRTPLKHKRRIEKAEVGV